MLFGNFIGSEVLEISNLSYVDFPAVTAMWTALFPCASCRKTKDCDILTLANRDPHPAARSFSLLNRMRGKNKVENSWISKEGHFKISIPGKRDSVLA